MRTTGAAVCEHQLHHGARRVHAARSRRYDEKHNEANGEENRDGENNNHSWNSGVEGPTDDPGIRALRERQKRNLLTTLLLSQGVPMISHGDEVARTQLGNNKPYCRTTSSPGQLGSQPGAADAPRFTAKLVHFRLCQPTLHRASTSRDATFAAAT